MSRVSVSLRVAGRQTVARGRLQTAALRQYVGSLVACPCPETHSAARLDKNSACRQCGRPIVFVPSACHRSRFSAPLHVLPVQVGHQPFISVFERYKNAKGKQAKLKAPEELQTFLKAVVEVADHLPQLRRQSMGADNGSDRDSSALSLSAEQSEDCPQTADAQEQIAQERAQLAIIRRVLQQGNHFSGINRKVQLKPILVDDGTGCVRRLQVIVKWGGVLTPLGRRQAEELGNTYRMVMYPQSADGGGLLRLHSTYRHDLKIYSSDEGRVQTSAAAFAKGLLDLEGESLVSTCRSSAHRACTSWRPNRACSCWPRVTLSRRPCCLLSSG